MPCEIYGMINPINRMIFYVGISANSRIREKQHKILHCATIPMAEVIHAINYVGLVPDMVILASACNGARLGFSNEKEALHGLLKAGSYLVNINNVPEHYKCLAFLAAEFHAKACYASNVPKGLIKEGDSLDQIKEKAGLPRLYGKGWLKEEKRVLWKRFLAGDSILELVRVFQRDLEAVIVQLKRLPIDYGTRRDRLRLEQEVQRLRIAIA